MNRDGVLRLADKYLSQYKVPVPIMTLVSMVAVSFSGDWYDVCSYVHTCLKEDIDAGKLLLTKGKNGGISKASVPMSCNQVDGIKVETVNNHVCPCCSNERVSKSERTCWRCGGNLH